MVRYRRNFAAGGTFFFTVTLAGRRSKALIDHMNSLRDAISRTQRRYPFTINAIVVLPGHLHVVMTLPENDADFSNRWSGIKRRFTDNVSASGRPVTRRPNSEPALWQRRFWEHTIRDERDFEQHVDYIHFNPCEARSGRAGARLAALVVSSLRAERNFVGRLGRRLSRISS